MKNHISPDHILQIGFGFWASKTLLSAVERETTGANGAPASTVLIELKRLRVRIILHK